MQPVVASVVCGLGILGLFYLNRDPKVRTSPALWLAVIWLSLGSSRMLSQWVSAANASENPPVFPDQLLEGSPLDRNLVLGLILVGVIVLLSRRYRVIKVARQNAPFLLFFLYCGVSALWSDYTDVSLKRWIKALGDLVMMLIVLTDPDRLSAIKRLLSRVAFVVIPASILVIKYYPNLGRGYSAFTGQATYNGVTLNKNQLGYLCLLFGLASAWQILEALRETKNRLLTGPLIAHGVIFTMIIWLFWMADSMTSFACFLMAGSMVLAAYLGVVGCNPWRVHLLVAAMLSVAVGALCLDLGTSVVQTMGRDPTLTGRTDIWKLVLGMAPNSLIGAGFESFWLGARLQAIWNAYWWHPVQSHNGYIDVFLDLGGVGICVLAVTLISAYRNIVSDLQKDLHSNVIRLGYWVAAVAYNLTESAFVMLHPVWICLLLAGVKVPGGWTPTASLKTRGATQRHRTLCYESAQPWEQLSVAKCNSRLVMHFATPGKTKDQRLREIADMYLRELPIVPQL